MLETIGLPTASLSFLGSPSQHVTSRLRPFLSLACVYISLFVIQAIVPLVPYPLVPLRVMQPHHTHTILYNPVCHPSHNPMVQYPLASMPVMQPHHTHTILYIPFGHPCHSPNVSTPVSRHACDATPSHAHHFVYFCLPSMPYPHYSDTH